ncbi:fungal specific transcription factor [Pyrenophora seminiperda CCB06]|uniref:Fungal specific transcription factor n=1 Tax=Pyrenophora seminiperda CCB06 TaxID=1302712 RepID=A0A3M7LXM5_9PLEO|nr:fungal specific transcription factor [Pyrenophora seminiperda CCB06]
MQMVWQAGSTPIRKRTASACLSCRSRKKRCYHTSGRNSKKLAHADGIGILIQPDNSNTNARKSSPSPGRVSEYNPESILVALSEDAVPEPGAQVLETALQPIPPAVVPSPSATYEEQRRLAWYEKHKTRVAPRSLSEAHRRYLEDEGAFIVLPKTTTDALLPLYISLLDDLTPITNGASVFRDYSNGRASIYLVRAICLVVCKTVHAAPFLQLTESGPLLEPLDFASKLLAGLDAAIKADLEPDRVIKVQILALMHLHNDGLAGVDRASSYLSQAICEAWSMCLHLKIPGNPDKDICEYLWWSLRNFDRLGKPIMAAAPFFIDDADIGINRITPEKSNYRSRIMSVALNLGDLMTAATKSYKAGFTSAVDSCQVFPPLSEVIHNVNFDQFHKSHRVYLEVWYHVAAMLSCRYSGPGTVPYTRRFTSANLVLDLVSTEGVEVFPPLPLVPYAVSMSTTVIYRDLHDGERDINEACELLRRCCDALDVLGQRWTSVRGVTKLAKRLWRLIDSGNFQGLLDVHRGRSSGGRGSGKDAARTTGKCGCCAGRLSEHGPHLSPCVMHSGTTPPQEPRPPYPNQDFQRQFTEIWPGIDTAYSQIDWTFQDWFDYELSGSFDEVP